MADVASDTFAFGWARTAVDPALLALRALPQWQPYLAFPGEFVASQRLVRRWLLRTSGLQVCDYKRNFAWLS